MQITNEVRDRIYANYLGCRIKIDYPSSNYPQYTMVDKKFLLSLQDKNEGLSSHYKYNKLLLTPLSKITDEHAIEVCKILELQFSNTDENYFFDLAGVADYLVEMFRDENRFGDAYTFFKTTQVIDIMRSFGYNCGYGPYTPEQLITANLATDATL